MGNVYMGYSIFFILSQSVILNEVYMEITVIMPVYNAEADLHISINSLINQTCGKWKLICVDDGSTDNSRTIVEQYCIKDSRISMICQENAGPAVARARAIAIAETEYIAILDSDDSYSADYIEKVIDRALETDADSIVPNVWFGRNGKPVRQKLYSEGSRLKEYMIIEDGKEAFALTIPWMLHGWQVVKTKLAKQYYTLENASYSKFNSDEYITRLLYLKSDKVALCSACYNHTLSNCSITHAASIKQLDYLLTLDKLCELCVNESIPYEVRSRLFVLYHDTLSYCYDIACNFPKDDRIKGLKIIKSSYEQSYRKYMSVSLAWRCPMNVRLSLMLSLMSFRFINGKEKRLFSRFLNRLQLFVKRIKM